MTEYPDNTIAWECPRELPNDPRLGRHALHPQTGFAGTIVGVFQWDDGGVDIFVDNGQQELLFV
jgi:hypothetical protein